jgi:hypothetical protein
MEVFAIGYNTSYWLKTNPFFIVNVKAPVRYTDNCLKLSYQF